MSRILTIFLVILTILFTFTASVHAETRIHNWACDITVNNDGSLDVREDIEATYYGQRSGRIVRQIDMIYFGPMLSPCNIDIKSTGALRDGKRSYVYADYELGDKGSKKAMFVEIPTVRGTHRYTVTYIVKDALRYKHRRDILVWDVTDEKRRYDVERVSVTLHLSHDIPRNQIRMSGQIRNSIDVFSNRRGSLLPDGSLTCTSTGPKEGESLFQCVASWPSGYVKNSRDIHWFSLNPQDNLELLIALMGLALATAYYLHAKRLLGGFRYIETDYRYSEVPNGISPGLMGYMVEMRLSNQSVVAILTDMAVKGRVRFRLLKNKLAVQGMSESEFLPDDEREFVSNLLGEFSAVKLIVSLQKQMVGAKRILRDYYRERIDSQYFEKYYGPLRFGYLVPLLTFAASTTAIMVRDSFEGAVSIAMTFLFVMCGLPFMLIAFAGDTNRRRLPHGSRSMWKKATKGCGTCFTTCIGAFFGVWIPLALFLVRPHGFAPTYLLPIAISWVLYFKAKKMFSYYSESGRALMEKIQGFKHFLADPISGQNVIGLEPHISTSLFQEYLPYALALGVAVPWAERFAAENPEAAAAYSPSWYIQDSSDEQSAVDFAYYLDAVLLVMLNRITNTKQAYGKDWQCTEEELHS